MIDFTEIPPQGDTWELFARDFLKHCGFYIESPPDRGADGGKDILVVEKLNGAIGNYRLRWLVSCKHHAKSGNSVTEKDEINLLERIQSFSADGFIGFYSTIASSGLNNRLSSLRGNGSIKDYKIFDHREIENNLITIGYSTLMLRYFPDSYKIVRPLHQILDKYLPLTCRHCGKDLLQSLYKEEDHQMGIIVRIYEYTENFKHIHDVYACCKGECDRLQSCNISKGLNSGWEDISDLAIPLHYLHNLMLLLKAIREGRRTYADEAFEKERDIYIALSQKVLRETSGREMRRVLNLFELDNLCP